ncbi:MAG: NAD(P)H-dependent glycerol-3-phosphate dehydrogenase [Bradymonadia bacterium]
MTTAIIGGGSWGTALACVLAEKGPVNLWARDPNCVASINATHRNNKYQSDLLLPKNIRAHNEFSSCLQGVKLVCLVVPSHAMRDTIAQLEPFLPAGVPIVSASKGIENNSLMTMHEVLTTTLPSHYHRHLGYLSGPSFARETILKMATAVTVASTDAETAASIQSIFSTNTFRVYTTDDVVGVELGGATKNVIAIASGVVDGLKLGHNTRAALITRGLAEVTRLATELGANPLTLAGLAGMGDLVLTCSGDLSRNRKVGLELAAGKQLPEIIESMAQVAEGIKTTQSVYDLGQRHSVEMPIATEVYNILYKDKTPATALRDLMTRDLRHERE